MLDSMATGDFAMSLISGQHGRVGFGVVRSFCCIHHPLRRGLAAC